MNPCLGDAVWHHVLLSLLSRTLHVTIIIMLSTEPRHPRTNTAKRRQRFACIQLYYMRHTATAILTFPQLSSILSLPSHPNQKRSPVS